MADYQCKVINSNTTFLLSSDETILSAAHEAGVKLPYRCAAGHCGVCKVRLTAGEVKMDHSGGISRNDIASGYILPCCSIPLTHLEIEPGSSC
ncbi:2Fe-2S iron-sulfur cluster-binding protein [Pectobacteriaceae bacterium CE70]|uniref:2Fe-2S iron-sulfur cluster-binding protein n=1 Tax=Brenneria uluponensis TaxID=3057057 RepID=UPI0028EF7F1E|nr:2Fe-2S iron-sulfur cluster-binding protein [Brenneria ulupoensis]WJV61406.1 2Fe-2S iron-sulfur cluster-binding protein [Pectobacteriaceae bacterium C52]WJV65678.1 2Fe-2S iron-sulfur cluster-binding protein [Pectobacteriaceae bacterium CE70]WJY09699.1 2Fe-2S iron-sulfur cluster-binding protein [Pectobacteriaceae bacterium C80]